VPPRRADRVAVAYRRQVDAIHGQVAAQLEAAYDDEIDPADIEASFRAFVERTRPTIEAGQATTAVLAAAFIRTLGLVQTGDAPPLVEEPPVLGSVPDRFAALPSLVLSTIANGGTIEDAVAYGRQLATGAADQLMTQAADDEVVRQSDALPTITGWRGVVEAGACDPCQDNGGDHDLDEEMYRHPHCGCTRVPIFG
jgi:hypothetical protein